MSLQSWSVKREDQSYMSIGSVFNKDSETAVKRLQWLKHTLQPKMLTVRSLEFEKGCNIQVPRIHFWITVWSKHDPQCTIGYGNNGYDEKLMYGFLLMSPWSHRGSRKSWREPGRQRESFPLRPQVRATSPPHTEGVLSTAWTHSGGALVTNKRLGFQHN